MENNITIPLEDVKEGMVATRPIFVRNKMGASVMLVKNNSQLTEDIIKQLHAYGVKSLSVFDDGSFPRERTLDYIREKVLERLRGRLDEDVPRPILSEDFTNEAIGSIRDLFDMANGSTAFNAPMVVKQLEDVIKEMVKTLTKPENKNVHITQLKSYDEYTYHHSLSVTVLSVAIGRKMNMSNIALETLARCAIVHDIGKIFIPLDILNKTSKLTEKEFKTIQTHSALGSEYLKKQQIGDRLLWDVVRGHHEKFDGSGYPDRLMGKEIPLFSRIISAADIYDAITSNRPYRDPMSPSQAFETIMSEAGKGLEYEVVLALDRAVEFYPIGSTLALSDGSIGIVADNKNPLRPTLEMLPDNSPLDLAKLDKLEYSIVEIIA